MAEREGAAKTKSGDPDPLLGRSINDRFKITSLIARGGMGKVYRAEQTPLGRICAVKVLNPNYSGEQDPEFHKRFFLEASVAAKLTHPNTVTIFDYGRTDDDVYFMAMEYLEGKTLHRAIREARNFPEERVAHVARQICRALREAHGLQVIHRDLKPANIFLVSHGDEVDFVKVLDFGLVKNVSDKNDAEDLTQNGLFMGSPKYMAPEQIRGDRVDARTDVYSLGIILYEMLTGKVPFDKSNSVNTLMAHVNEPPPPLRVTNPAIVVSPHMEEIVARCLAKDPDTRFTSMDELLGHLKKIASSTTSPHTSEFDSVMPPPVAGPSEITHRLSEPPQATGSSGVVSTLGSEPLPSSPWPSQTPLRAAPAAPVLPPGIGMPSGALQPGADTPPWRGRKAPAIFVVAGLLVAGAAAFALASRQPAMQGSSPAATPSVAAEPLPRENPVLSSAVSQPVPPLLAKVRVSSEPDGATVREDGVEICTSTPCDVTYRGPDAEGAREHKLIIAKGGYRSETKIFKVGDTPISVRLARASAGAQPLRAVDPGKQPEKAPVQIPEGYKDLPPY